MLNTIITSLKALDESFSSRNHVRNSEALPIENGDKGNGDRGIQRLVKAISRRHLLATLKGLMRLEVNSLKLKLASFENSSLSLQKMVEMQKPSKDKCGLGYTETITSPRNTKIKNLGDHLKKLSVEPASRCHSSIAPACSIEQHRVSDDSAKKRKRLGNQHS
ncbi:hypothetical protein Tco_0405548 [Tanacetum coccineum]